MNEDLTVVKQVISPSQDQEHRQNVENQYESLDLMNKETSNYDEIQSDKELTTTEQVQHDIFFNVSLTHIRLVLACFVVVVTVLLTNTITGIVVFHLKTPEESIQKHGDCWSEWSEWTVCPKCSCSTQSRSRKCKSSLSKDTHDSDCKGISIEVSDCCNTNCSYEVPTWKLMFRGIPNIGSDVFDAWLDNNNIITDKNENGPSSHSKHYRNPLIDHWEYINIRMAKYSLFKNGSEAAYVTFSALNSNKLSWFQQTNILKSSWKDIKDQSWLNYCNLYGDGYKGRRFFVSLTYNSCPGDKLYTAAITSQGHLCKYDKHSTYPQFLYANGSTYGLPESMTNMDFADYMEVSILV